MIEAQELLAEFVQEGSETAFRVLVTRYLDLVYSTAVRMVEGDAHRAEDVAQTVFVDLARLAPKLSKETMLGGWLHRHTCFVAANLMRAERRRQARERKAAEIDAMNHHADSGLAQIAPILDEVINELSDEDRTAILLRFYERRELRLVGEALGSSENAAQKRVSRALDQLRTLLQRRGVSLSTTALGTILAAEVVTSAPAGLAASIMATALAGSTAGTGTAFTALKFISMTKLQLGLVSAIVITGITAGLVIQLRSSLELREENKSMRQQIERMDQLRAENERLSNQVTLANQAKLLSKDQFAELIRLRGEIGVLRQQKRDLDKMAAQKRPALSSLPEQPDRSALPFQLNLVVDDFDENAEVMTNHVTAADGKTTQETLYVRKSPAMDYTSIRSANVVSDPSSGTPQIEILFNDQGREQFAQITKENINKRLAIAIDGQVYSAPMIRSEISGGKAMISGSFTEEQARELAEKINQALANP